MFRKFKKSVHAIESMQSAVQKPMRTIKMGFQYILISVYVVRSNARIQRAPPPLKKSQKYRIS